MPVSDTVFVRRVLLVVGLGALTALVGWLVVVGIQVLLLAFASVLLALFVRGLARVLVRHASFTDRLAVITVVMVLVALTGFGSWLLAPRVAEEAIHLAERLPQAVKELRDTLRASAWGGAVTSYAPDPETLAQRFLLGDSGGGIVATLGWIVGGTVNLAFVLFIGIYVALSPGPYRRGILLLVPPGGRDRAHSLFDRLGAVLERWLVGKAAAMLVTATLTAVGLTIIGVPAALALGVVAGLLNFIPYLGPVLGFAPAALLALMQSPDMFAWVLALYALIQVLESYVITPLIQQEAVSLPAALILGAQVLLGMTVGWLGLLLATPVTACVVVVIDQLYVRRPRPAVSDAGRRDRDAAA